MSGDYKKYISGEGYENQKKYYKCTFPKPSGLLCNQIGTLNDTTYHIAQHLKLYRYECRLCKDRFLEKIQYEVHKARRNCRGVLSVDLAEKEFNRNAETELWRCTNVFVQQISGAELIEHRRKVKQMREMRNGQGRHTPCYNEEEASAEPNSGDPRAVGSGFSNHQTHFGGYQSYFPASYLPPVAPQSNSYSQPPVAPIPQSNSYSQPPVAPPPQSYSHSQPPVAPPPQSNALSQPWEPPQPLAPYRPPPNYAAMSQSAPGRSARELARSRVESYNLLHGRRGRARTPIALPVEEPTGVYSLVPKKPQEIRRRSSSRVNYGHERSKSPIAYSEPADIQDTARLKAAFQTQSRSTAKVPNMRNSRNAVLLEIPQSVPKKPKSQKEIQDAVREQLAKNAALQTKMKEKRKRSSRSRSP